MVPSLHQEKRILTCSYRGVNMRKCTIFVLLAAVILLYISFQASRALVSLSMKPGTYSSLLRFNHGEENEEHFGDKGGKIILMTYGRSGSSFTSEVIQQDPNVFYTFEPLYNMIRRFNVQEKHGAFLNTTEGKAEYDRQSIELMEIFLTCGFETMKIADINNYQLRNSEDSRLLWGCVQKKDHWTPAAVVDCFIQSRKTCLNHTIRMVKTIRFRGTAACQIMEKHDDLKLLYLIRDPRGTITSQIRTFHHYKWEEVDVFAAKYCQTIREDLAEIAKLIDRYPQRVKIVCYESLAKRPLEMSEELYRFLGLEYTSAVRTFVFNRTMAGKTANSAYGTSRSNSSKAAYSWRTILTFSAAQTIDRNCRDIYETLGYTPVNSEKELRDFSHELRKPAKFQGQLI